MVFILYLILLLFVILSGLIWWLVGVFITSISKLPDDRKSGRRLALELAGFAVLFSICELLLISIFQAYFMYANVS